MEHKPLTWQYVPIALTFYTYILQEEFAVLAAMSRGIQTSTKHRVRLKEVVTQYALTRRAGFQEQYLDLFVFNSQVLVIVLDRKKASFH